MARAILDCSLFAAPPSHADSPELDEYLERLLLLDEIARSRCVDLAVSSRTVDALARAESYPIIDRYPKDRFPQRADVLRVITSMTDRLPYIEDTVGISDLLNDDCVYTPALAEDHRPVSLREHMDYLCSVLGFANEAQRRGLLNVIFTDRVLGHQSYVVSGAIHDVEYLDGGKGVPTPPGLPLRFANSVTLSEVEEGLASCNRLPIAQWLNARYEQALRIYIHQQRVLAGGTRWPVPALSCRLGRQFIKSVTALGFDRDARKAELLMRACAEVALGVNLTKSHALRANASGGSGQVQRTSDGARAMRHDLDYEYHLHYWVTADGQELAAVVVHNDFDIPL